MVSIATYPIKVRNGKRHLMTKECPLNSRSKCEIWTDYQAAYVVLHEAKEPCSSNLKEISYLLNGIELSEARLTEAGIPIPE